MKDILIGLAIVVALAYAIAIIIVPDGAKDCCYCGTPVELMVDQNHWHDGQSVICNDCWRLGRR